MGPLCLRKTCRLTRCRLEGATVDYFRDELCDMPLAICWSRSVIGWAKRCGRVLVYPRWHTAALCEANDLIDEETIETMKEYCRPPEEHDQ